MLPETVPLLEKLSGRLKIVFSLSQLCLEYLESLQYLGVFNVEDSDFTNTYLKLFKEPFSRMALPFFLETVDKLLA